MLTEASRHLFRAVSRQSYENVYILQSVPLLGPIVSIPITIASAIMAIIKLAQVIFQNLKDNEAYFQNEELNVTPLTSAMDFSIIFINNVMNICTLGILNNYLVLYVLTQIGCE